MRLYTYLDGGRETVGALAPSGRLVPLGELGSSAGSMNQLIETASPQELAALARELKGAGGGIPLEEAALLAPIPAARQHVVCIEDNYCRDQKEAEAFRRAQLQQEPAYPRYTFKRAYAVNGPGGAIPAHTGYGEDLDYGAELAVITRGHAKGIGEEQAKEYIFGYAILNDITAMNLVEQHKRAFLAKSLDGFCPLGPCIVTADEFDPGESHAVRSWVNGELRQDGKTDLMRFSPTYILAELAAGMTLTPGSILASGTPFGTGKHFDPGRYLHPGDVVVCEIHGIGRLENRVQ